MKVCAIDVFYLWMLAFSLTTVFPHGLVSPLRAGRLLPLPLLPLAC